MSARPHRRARGFTLVELMIVIGVVGLLATMAVPAVEAVTGANARKAAGELAGTMRYLFDTAALRHQTCRLALDHEARTWWAECSASRGGLAAATPSDPEEEKRLEERFPDEKDAEVRRLLARTAFGAFKDRLAGERELPGDTAFGAIRVEGRREASEAGVAYVYFYPGGRAQRAWVPLEDGDYLYTVVLESFTGRARVVPGPVEVRE